MNTNHSQRESQGLCERVAFLVPARGRMGSEEVPVPAWRTRSATGSGSLCWGLAFLALISRMSGGQDTPENRWFLKDKSEDDKTENQDACSCHSPPPPVTPSSLAAVSRPSLLTVLSHGASFASAWSVQEPVQEAGAIAVRAGGRSRHRRGWGRAAQH